MSNYDLAEKLSYDLELLEGQPSENLVETGPQGQKGDTGNIGPAGADGAPGSKGDKGDTGATGAAGPAAITVGTTAVNSGTSGRALYDGSGNVVRENAAHVVATSGVLNTMQAQDATDTPLQVKGAANQSAPLQEWRTSTGTLLGVMDASGRFGIGKSSPQAAIDMVGDIIHQGDILNGGATGSGVSFSGGQTWNTGGNFILYGTTHASFPSAVRIKADGNEAIFVNASGNVGIGTTSPSQKLHLYGTTPFAKIESSTNQGNGFLLTNTTQIGYNVICNATANSTVGIGEAANAYLIGLSGSNPLQFATGNAVKMTLDGAGKLGIGTTSPSCALDVNGGIRPALKTVGTLPVASTMDRAFYTVSDANVAFSAAVLGNTVAGGGANELMVRSKGGNWIIWAP